MQNSYSNDIRGLSQQAPNYGDNWRDGANIWMGGQYYFKNRDSMIGN